MTNPHRHTYTAWLHRVDGWLKSGRGNTSRLARALNIDRRRLSQWFSRSGPSVPGWAVAPISKLTGQVIHTDHLQRLEPLPPQPTTTTTSTHRHASR